jgi:hypothetical protein
MRTVPRVLLIVGAAAVVPLAVWVYDVVKRDRRPPVAANPGNANNPTATKPAPAGANPQPNPNPRPLAGIAGCGAGACHGGQPTGMMSSEIWQSSFNVWRATDPHTQTYTALTKPLAKTIVEGLHWTAAATEQPRCLACHTNPALASDAVRRTEGMDCAACHGKEELWGPGGHNVFGSRNRHEAYESLGLPKLFDLGTRADVCVGCHVGAPADPSRGLPLRDMNHDMIAAGHPPLTFDFADAMHRMPKHWFEKDRTASDPRTPAGPALDAKAWLVGRVAVASAACALLADRATRADPWPEFAEMNCTACHHEFEPKGWRLSAARRSPARKPGMAAWQTVWPVTRADDFVKLNSDVSHDLTALIASVERTRSPNEKAVAASAAAVAGKLGRVREELSRLPAKDAAKLARAVFLAVPQERADFLDWDEAKQVYAGLAAIDRSTVQKVGGAADPLLAKFEEHMQFARDPENWFRRPRGYDPAAGRDLLRECLKSVPARADVIER